jgi:hypothetical protein
VPPNSSSEPHIDRQSVMSELLPTVLFGLPQNMNVDISRRSRVIVDSMSTRSSALSSTSPFEFAKSAWRSKCTCQTAEKLSAQAIHARTQVHIIDRHMATFASSFSEKP